MQQLVIDVTSQPFADYMQHVLEPLDMKQSRYEQPLDVAIHQAVLGHRKDLVPVPGGFHVYPELAAAGLWTTPSDLAALAIEVANTAIGRPGRLLSKRDGERDAQAPKRQGWFGLFHSRPGSRTVVWSRRCA